MRKFFSLLVLFVSISFYSSAQFSAYPIDHIRFGNSRDAGFLLHAQIRGQAVFPGGITYGSSDSLHGPYYISKIDSLGSALWAKEITPPTGSGYIREILDDFAGNVYLKYDRQLDQYSSTGDYVWSLNFSEDRFFIDFDQDNNLYVSTIWDETSVSTYSLTGFAPLAADSIPNSALLIAKYSAADRQ